MLREHKLNFAHWWWVAPGSRRPQGYSVFQILNWGLINVTNTILITNFLQGAREAFKIDLGPKLLFHEGNWPKGKFHAFRLILCSNWLINSLPNEQAVPTENLNKETKAQIELHLVVEKWNWTDIWRWNKSNTVLYLGPHLNFGETCYYPLFVRTVHIIIVTGWVSHEPLEFLSLCDVSNALKRD